MIGYLQAMYAYLLAAQTYLSNTMPTCEPNFAPQYKNTTQNVSDVLTSNEEDDLFKRIIVLHLNPNTNESKCSLLCVLL